QLPTGLNPPLRRRGRRETMKVTETELKELMRGRRGEAGAGGGDHLAEELLQRAAEQKLDRRERVLVISHLRRCVDCARDYRMALQVKRWSDEVAATFVPGAGERPIPVVSSTWLERARALLAPPRAAVALGFCLLLIAGLIAGLVLLEQEHRRTANL